jgi:circadian clock protein KaiC
VFPRLLGGEPIALPAATLSSSGDAQLDALLGGGFERGTSALLIGGAGVGKSSIALTYAVAAAERGETAVIFAFDEGLGTIYARAAGLGIPLQAHVEAGRIRLQQIDPAEMSPGEFAQVVRRSVERDGARLVVIDSLNGYLNAMPEERYLVLQMHELLSYLGQLGVVSILVLAQHGMMGPMQTPIDISYLSDAVLMLRYFEADGRVRRAISLVKKRSGAHEDTIREFRLSSKGLQVGPPLTGFRGILTGTPVYGGGPKPLMQDGDDGDRGDGQ